ADRLRGGTAGHGLVPARHVGRAPGESHAVSDGAAGGRDDDRKDGGGPPGPTAGTWTGGRNPWTIALVVTLATFMEVLDTSIANVSLPHIAGNLSVTPD